jgi:hypothetical protein
VSTTEVNLKVTGTVDVLRLQPGDRILVTIDDWRHITPEQATALCEQLSEKFPGHEVVVLAGMRFTVETAA